MIRAVTRRSIAGAGLLSLLCFYLADRLAALFSAASGSWLERLTAALDGLAAGVLAKPLYLSLSASALQAGLLAAAAVWLAWLYWLSGVKNYMPGREHGSAR